ncbi:MAG: asparagine synthase (glutamine-hydrolyzing) [Deltaproteobacteria bacterium]|nr:asparagine synthase (glutamine-hydrolyzing) [Deltaproteobacteria bacterium]MBW1915430.1 asparagine synthase (glutamine-hydrolyzing) [Deltaproteobacteria bacterium]
MCGICGKLNFHGTGITEELIRKMTSSLSYRGPDHEGIFVSPPVGLGHRRLSIIDLSPSGHQPMKNEDGSIFLVFNGEIYDFEEIRADLKEKGHRLSSRTDSETIIHLYEDEGTDFLDRLNGMFAFALWDSTRQELWLVRDRLGIKPLYYYWDGSRLIFASEIKAILADPDVPREMDWKALDLYLTLNYIPAPWTIFKNIRKLCPGEYLIGDKEGISIRSYWDIEPQIGVLEKINFNEHKKQLYEKMEGAVRRRLISDVPLGAFLSGGIDSSIIVALMARNSNNPIKTFSIGYKDLPLFDETRYAREVAEFNNTDHQEFKLDSQDILDAFPAVLENLDEPFADSSAVPTYIVSRETRSHVTVALSGDGGDELFAGYRMYQGELWAKYYNAIPAFVRKRFIEPVINVLPDARDKAVPEQIRRIKKFIRGMSSSFAERYYGWREIFPHAMRRQLLNKAQLDFQHLDFIRDMAQKELSRFSEDTINLMLYMDVRGLLHGDMLAKVDRMSMLNSLEVRVPFLDHTVAEYAFQLEGNLKLKGKTGKYILIETFKHLLPPSLHKRSKRGFEMPIAAWLRNDLKFLIDEYLAEDRIKRQGIFNFEVINNLKERHLKGRQDTSWLLWNLIVFQYWYRTYMSHIS